MSNRPLVAVSTSFSEGGEHSIVEINDEYVRAVEQAGLVPLLVPPLDRPELTEDIADRVAGIVLTGGRDVDPACYGQSRHPSVDEPDPRRDATELALVVAARRRGIPMLGICRGCQVMNVALGGTLIQDLTSRPATAGNGSPVNHALEVRRHERVHPITVEAGSRLVAVTGTGSCAMNSLHHQAPDRVGDGLRVAARATDGVIEALESDDAGWWAVGVQWHPEELTGTDEEWDRALFAAFARAARDYAARLAS